MGGQRGHLGDLGRDLTCRMVIGAWLSAVVLLPTVTSCIPGKIEGGPTVGVETGSGGARGTGGATGSGGSGSGGASGPVALSCSGTPAGCICADRDSQATDLASCSTSSVAKNIGEQGACCQGADLCACDSYACKSDASLGYCQCARTSDIPGTLQGAALSDCPAPAAGQMCCFSADTHSCVCSAVDCDAGAMMVANCALAMVTVCGADQQVASSCK
jgi:hypothetical protein